MRAMGFPGAVLFTIKTSVIPGEKNRGQEHLEVKVIRNKAFANLKEAIDEIMNLRK
jgi:hypothetical protein